MPNSNSNSTIYNILVTGSMGQLGSEIKELASKYSYNFFFSVRNNRTTSYKVVLWRFFQFITIIVIIKWTA